MHKFASKLRLGNDDLQMTYADIDNIVTQAISDVNQHPKHTFRKPVVSALQRLRLVIGVLETGKKLADIQDPVLDEVVKELDAKLPEGYTLAGRVYEVVDEEKPKRKRAFVYEPDIDIPVPKKRGRPKGSKNKPK